MMLSRYKVIDKLNTTQYLTIEEREELLDLLEQAEDKTIYYNLYVLLQARIDKAIEYLEKHEKLNYTGYLLAILKGSGKE